MEKRLAVNELLALAAANWPEARARMTEVVIQITRAAECTPRRHASAIAPFRLQPKDFAIILYLSLTTPYIVLAWHMPLRRERPPPCRSAVRA